MPYPTKALQEYVLKSDLVAFGGSGVGPPGPTGATGAPGAQGASWVPAPSVTAPITTNGGTIATSGLTVSRVAPAADVIGVILAAGTVSGQQVCVLNEGGSSVTFAVAATSNVSIGTACLISGGTHLQFVWNSVTFRWYPATVGSVSIPPVSLNFSGQVVLRGLSVSGAVLQTSGAFVVTGAVVLRGLSAAGTLSTSGSTSGTYGDGLYGSGVYGL